MKLRAHTLGYLRRADFDTKAQQVQEMKLWTGDAITALRTMRPLPLP